MRSLVSIISKKKVLFASFLFILLSFTLLSCFANTAKADAENGYIEGSGWLFGWDHRKLIRLNTSMVSGGFDNIHLVLKISNDADIGAYAISNGNDIRITKADGTTLLDYEIEDFSISNGVANGNIWFKTPLDNSESNFAYIYYGNAGASSGQNATNVWNDGYNAYVGHLNVASTGAAGEFIDSSGSGGNSASTVGSPERVDGIIGKGQLFDGTDCISIDNYAKLTNNTITVSFWMDETAGHGSEDTNWVVDKSINYAGYGFRYKSGTVWEMFSYFGGWNLYDASISSGFTGTPKYIVSTYSNQNVITYINGQYIGTQALNNALSANIHPFVLGGSYNYQAPEGYAPRPLYYGMLDEVEISSGIARSQDWVNNTYKNQKYPSTFFTYSSDLDYTTYQELSSSGNPPVAAYSATPLSGEFPLEVAFTDSSTNTPTSCLWNFGDTQTSTGQNPTHTYATPGTYTVVLTASNSDGSDSEEKTGYITVTTPANNEITTYVVPAINDTIRVIPNGSIYNIYLGSNITVKVAKGETTDASFVFNPDSNLSNINLTLSDFTDGTNTLPASAIDVKYVVPWYYGTTATFDEHITGRYLMPDLLVYDRSLVKVNETQGGSPTQWDVSNPYGKNYLKPNTGVYQDVSTTGSDGLGWQKVSQRPIYDAANFQATDLTGGLNQQYMITLRIPNSTTPGTYTGTITATNGTHNFQDVNVTIQVLPFELDQSHIEYGLYYHSFLDPLDQGEIGWVNKSEVQFAAEIRDLVDHGMTHPLFNPGQINGPPEPNGISDAKLERMLELRRENGIEDKTLYVWNEYANESKIAIRDWYAARGIEQLYLYGLDENPLNRGEVEYEHTIGIKHFNAVSITLAAETPDILDYAVCLDIDPAMAANYHSNGNRIANYHQPMSAINYPELFRENAGIVLWQNNYDGWYDFSYQWANNGDQWQTTWSYDNLVPYCFAYPTANGVVPTVKWDGVREATTDVKYIQTLQNEINETPSTATAIEAQAYLNNLKNTSVSSLDMYEERATMQDYITALTEPTIATYVVPAFNDTKILPKSNISNALESSNLSTVIAKGERTSESFVIKSSMNISNLTVEVSNFSNGSTTLSSSISDVRALKCWYQAGYQITDWRIYNYTNPSEHRNFLTPELLLHNTSMIQVIEDNWTQYNVSNPNGANFLYLPDGTAYNVSVNYDQNIDNKLIHDVSTLQPLNLSSDYNQQFFITFNVPANATAGNYTGTITLKNNTETFQTMNVSLRVLPFALPNSTFENSIAFTASIVPDNWELTAHMTPEANYRAQLQNLIDHGIQNPMIWGNEDESVICKELEIRQEMGINNSNMYYKGTFPLEDSERLYALFAPYGVEKIYIYGFDEQEINVTQVQATQAAGYYYFAAQQAYPETPEHPEVLDLSIEQSRMDGPWPLPPTPAVAAAYHQYGHKVLSYGNPQSAPEYPRGFRWHYGLLLWQANFNGSCMFTYNSYVNDGYNDFSDMTWYERQNMVVYPDNTSVVDTAHWEGFAEGQNDVRYIAALENAIENSTDPTNETVVEAQDYLDTLKTQDLATTDLDEVKATLQDYTVNVLALRSELPEPESTSGIRLINDTNTVVANASAPISSKAITTGVNASSMLLVFVNGWNNFGSCNINGVTDSQGNTYTPLFDEVGIGNSIRGRAFYTFASSTGTNTITASMTGKYDSMRVIELAGVNTTTPLDFYNYGATATYEYATAEVNDSIIMLWNIETTGTPTLNNGFSFIPGGQIPSPGVENIIRPASMKNVTGTESNSVIISNAGTERGFWAIVLRPENVQSEPPASNPPVAAFLGNPLSGNKPLEVVFTDSSTNTPVSWDWDFGDGTTHFTVQNPSHTYSEVGTYTVILTATNKEGSDSETKTNYIIVSEPQSSNPPISSFTASPTSGYAPVEITFTDTSTNDPTSWLWNFGDGNTSTSSSVSHTYVSHTYYTPGAYNVSLRTQNEDGFDYENKTEYITVSEAPEGTYPVANFSSSRTSARVGQKLRFTDTSASSITSWAWDFNEDGIVDSTQQNPSYQYWQIGTWNVSLTATNSTGSDTKTEVDYMTITAPQSTAEGTIIFLHMRW